MPAVNLPFSLVPQQINIKTRHRHIEGYLPNQEALQILESLLETEVYSVRNHYPMVWATARNHNVSDMAGNRWIDFASSIFVANTGHGNKHILKAIANALRKGVLHSYVYPTNYRKDFIVKLLSLLPSSLNRVYLASSGTEANEAIIKLFKLWGQKFKRNQYIMCFEGAYHGRTMGASLYSGTSKSRAWIGFEDQKILRFSYPLSFESKDYIKRFREELGYFRKTYNLDFSKDIAGALIEPLRGWCAYMLPSDFVEELTNFCQENTIKIAVDEVQSGFGRTGKLFAFQHYANFTPNLIACGKGISSSLPLSAVIGSEDIMNIAQLGELSNTHSGNAICCAAALANLEELIDHGILNKSMPLGSYFQGELRKLKERYPNIITEVYGVGMIASLMIISPVSHVTAEQVAKKICEQAFLRGLLLSYTGRNSVKIGPPLTIPKSALKEGLEVINEIINDILMGTFTE